MPGSLVRVGGAAQHGDAGSAQVCQGGIEQQECVTGSDYDLPCIGWRRRKRKKRARQPVEQGVAESRAALARERDKDLAARRVRRKPPGVAARVDDEDSQGSQDLLHGLKRDRQAARRYFAFKDMKEAEQSASSTADTHAPRVAGYDDLADIAEQFEFAAKGNLFAVRAGLKFI